MKRLSESRQELDQGELLLSDLVKAMPRTQTEPFRKRRIRQQLESKLRSKSGSHHFGRRAVIVWGCLCVATAAAAMIGGAKLASRTPDRRATAVTSGEERRLPAQSGSSLRSDATPPEAIPAETTPPDVAPRSSSTVSATTAERRAAPSTLGAAAAVRSAAPAASPSAVPAGEDPSLVAAAIQALRNENDPARARLLLARYMKNNPRGALAEEALALSIEAAVKMHDPRAQALARAYLQAYPKGRHRKLAEDVLAR